MDLNFDITFLYVANLWNLFYTVIDVTSCILSKYRKLYIFNL